MSNRDSERNEDKADPIEIILYAVFVATSARASVAELADILQVRAHVYTCGCMFFQVIREGTCSIMDESPVGQLLWETVKEPEFWE